MEIVGLVGITPQQTLTIKNTSMTYKQLREAIDWFSEDQLNQDVTIHHGIMDEYFAANSLEMQKGNDVLDDGHYMLKISGI